MIISKRIRLPSQYHTECDVDRLSLYLIDRIKSIVHSVSVLCCGMCSVLVPTFSAD